LSALGRAKNSTSATELRLALDTNIMVYAEGVSRTPSDAAKCALAFSMVERTAGETVVLPLQAAAELHNVLVRKGGLTATEAALRVRLWCAKSEVVSPGAAALEAALQLTEAHRLQIFDALILAAAAEGGSELLLSEDLHDGFVWRGVTVTNPFGSSPDARLARMLGTSN
jgi:predicted nucleic acid-binding protein